jgi:hypothetical protein
MTPALIAKIHKAVALRVFHDWHHAAKFIIHYNGAQDEATLDLAISCMEKRKP